MGLKQGSWSRSIDGPFKTPPITSWDLENTEFYIYSRDGRVSYFFHGAGRGKAKNLWGRAGPGIPPVPRVRDGAGKGSESAGLGGAGAGNILHVLIEIICCSKGNRNLHCIKWSWVTQQHQGWYYGHGGAISYVEKFLRTKFDALLAKKEEGTLLEKVEMRAHILPHKFPAVLIIFTGRGGAGNPPPPHSTGGASIPVKIPMCSIHTLDHKFLCISLWSEICSHTVHFMWTLTKICSEVKLLTKRMSSLSFISYLCQACAMQAFQSWK